MPQYDSRHISYGDLETLVDCFAPYYVNLTPRHPARRFRGRAQVRRNSTTFDAVPDIKARVIAAALDGNRVWSE